MPTLPLLPDSDRPKLIGVPTTSPPDESNREVHGVEISLHCRPVRS